MKREKLVCLAALLLMVLTSCGPQIVQENSLYPAMDLAWPGIRADAELAQDTIDGVDLDGFQESLVGRDEMQLKVDWPAVQVAANIGIDRRVDLGEASEGVAETLRERVIRFDKAINALVLGE